VTGTLSLSPPCALRMTSLSQSLRDRAHCSARHSLLKILLSILNYIPFLLRSNKSVIIRLFTTICFVNLVDPFSLSYSLLLHSFKFISQSTIGEQNTMPMSDNHPLFGRYSCVLKNLIVCAARKEARSICKEGHRSFH
jgi:hypothetical protein